MSGYNKYLENVYCDELTLIDPEEIDEINRLMAEEGYHDWSEQLEQHLDEESAWRGSKEFDGILIKKACEHSTCSHFKCERSLRIGGIEL